MTGLLKDIYGTDFVIQPNDSSLTILKQILWQDLLKQANVLP
jgi:hypothetical protein